ncbi:uncharacterized protein LOC113227335 [Hyposmocoma kahamanoa]|uniref:uncharacterized protein LOC113227335 n=1 Tax=Hyposmocoma kahamanoa TaxID=1477025 RepID=UPI000E6D77F9|nr:uncharacterized protein LOC113227335 [Hyposmocoma kahamanoa]
MSQNMDILRHFQNLSWCKPDWCFPTMTKETIQMLHQCMKEVNEVNFIDNVDEIIKRSKTFPVPFPIESVRLEKLLVRRPIEKLSKNIVSTYPLIHERVVLLMTHFLLYKREFGSSIEKAFYKDMTVPELVDRLLKKRAVAFFGRWDYYKLLSGEEDVLFLGLGEWKVSHHQPDVYVLTFLERIRAFLKKEMIDHVSDVNFSYIKATKSVKALFTNSSSPEVESTSKKEKRIFFESKRHPRGGINVQLKNREPSSKLTEEHEGKLLVMTYPWDGNAHPGNEFWLGSLDSSGDPAAACSTQVSELHNAHVNPAVCSNNAKVAGRYGIESLPDYCDKFVRLQYSNYTD